MKRFLLASVLTLGSIILNLNAALVDSDNMPIVYLRGNFNNTSWLPNESYRFTRTGSVYTLKIDSHNALQGYCKFKIGDEDWNLVDFGADQSINYSQYIECTRAGANMSTDGLNDCVISFTYVPDARNASVKFVVNGKDIEPQPVKGISGTLPVLYINVYSDEAHTSLNNEVINKDLNHKNYFEFAEYWLDVNGCEWLESLGAKNVGSQEEPLALQIKARGNYTRTAFSKKPFKLKLDKKQSLLGMSKSKHYAILAHADDQKGYMRNFVGFNLGKRIGLPWTPSQQPLEVVINGDYRGVYFLTESIRIEEERVNITELKDNVEDGSLASGGYIVELDNYDEEDSSQIRMDEKSYVKGQNLDKLRITFDTPEEYSEVQRWFIENQFSTMNDYVGSNNDLLWSYLDLDDAARYYLVNEIVSHTESYHGSTYLFRDYGDGQKWHFSPLWDFGNAFNGHTDDFFYNCDPFGNTWIPSMRENKKFNDKVRETWLWFMANEYSGVEKDIEEYASRLEAAAKADYDRWHNQPTPGQPVADNRDMKGKKNEVLNHLNNKIGWLKGKFGDFSSGNYEEPARDTTPAAELPPMVSTGIGFIETPESDTGERIYFNLQGIRISNPVPGNVYIMREGNKASKVILR